MIMLGLPGPVQEFFGSQPIHQSASFINSFLYTKNEKKFMTRFRKKSKKPLFWAILGMFDPLGGRGEFFSKIGIRQFREYYHSKHHAKFQKDSMNRF